MPVDSAGSPDAGRPVVVVGIHDVGHSTLDFGHLDNRNQSPGAGGCSHHRDDLLEDEPT